MAIDIQGFQDLVTKLEVVSRHTAEIKELSGELSTAAALLEELRGRENTQRATLAALQAEIQETRDEVSVITDRKQEIINSINADLETIKAQAVAEAEAAREAATRTKRALADELTALELQLVARRQQANDEIANLQGRVGDARTTLNNLLDKLKGL